MIANALRRVGERCERAERHAATIDQIDANAANSSVSHARELAVRGLLAHCGHAAQIDRIGRDRIEHRTDIGAMYARLHEHEPLDAERAMHAAQLRERQVRRRIRTIGLVWVAARWTEYVRVAVGSARRDREAWRIGIGRRTRPPHLTLAPAHPICGRGNE